MKIYSDFKTNWLFFRIWLCQKIMASEGIVIGCDISSSRHGILVTGTSNVEISGNRIVV